MIFETNVSVSFNVAPTRSARVIADKVSHSKSIDQQIPDNKMRCQLEHLGGVVMLRFSLRNAATAN